MRVVALRRWWGFRFVDLKVEIPHHFVIEVFDLVEIPNITRRFTGYTVVIGNDDVVVHVATLGIRVRHNDGIAVGCDAAREFLTANCASCTSKALPLSSSPGWKFWYNINP